MSAGISASAAAAAARRRQQEEEEEMTRYNAQELSEDWEFKILRSATNAFRHPDKLRRILEEEERAGWVLVEKFDNSRIRLKRRTSARTPLGPSDFDPYRTWVGPSETKLVLMIVGCLLAVGLGVLLISLILKTAE